MLVSQKHKSTTRQNISTENVLKDAKYIEIFKQ